MAEGWAIIAQVGQQHGHMYLTQQAVCSWRIRADDALSCKIVVEAATLQMDSGSRDPGMGLWLEPAVETVCHSLCSQPMTHNHDSMASLVNKYSVCESVPHLLKSDVPVSHIT